MPRRGPCWSQRRSARGCADAARREGQLHRPRTRTRAAPRHPGRPAHAPRLPGSRLLARRGSSRLRALKTDGIVRLSFRPLGTPSRSCFDDALWMWNARRAVSWRKDTSQTPPPELTVSLTFPGFRGDLQPDLMTIADENRKEAARSSFSQVRVTVHHSRGPSPTSPSLFLHHKPPCFLSVTQLSAGYVHSDSANN